MQSTAGLVTAVLLLVTTGCFGGAPASPTPSEPADLDGSWQLTSGQTSNGDVPILDDHPITLTIRGSEIGGRAACNSYGGRAVAGAGGLRMDALSRTEMACQEPAMAAESIYMTALGLLREIVREGDELIARGEGVELRYAALPAPS